MLFNVMVQQIGYNISGSYDREVAGVYLLYSYTTSSSAVQNVWVKSRKWKMVDSW